MYQAARKGEVLEDDRGMVRFLVEAGRSYKEG